MTEEIRGRKEISWTICLHCAVDIACKELGYLTVSHGWTGKCHRCKKEIINGERRYIVNAWRSTLGIADLERLGLHL